MGISALFPKQWNVPCPEWMELSITLLAAGRLSVNMMMFLHPVVVALSMARRDTNILSYTYVAFPAGALIEDIW